MKLFTRTQPTDSSLPPELQPYYGKPSRWAWWQQMGPRSRGAVLLATALIVVLLALLVWAVTKDNTSSPHGTSGNPSASQAPQNSNVPDNNPGKPATTPLSGGTTNAKPAE